MHNAIVVANKIIDYHNNTLSRDVNQQKLQKLLYICQGYHLNKTGQSLIREDFSTTLYGPNILGKFYKKIKNTKLEPMTKPIWTFFKKDRDINQLSDEEVCTIETVCGIFANVDAIRLSAICRRRDELGSAWHNIVNGNAEKLGKVIPRELIASSCRKERFDKVIQRV